MWLEQVPSRMGLICAAAVLALLPLGGIADAGSCRPSVSKLETAVGSARHCLGPRRTLPRLHKHRPRYSGKPITVRQLPNRMRPRPGARGDPTGSISAGHRPAPDLVDALLRAPDAETGPIIRSLGLPIIEGVPPVVLLEPGPERETSQGK